MFLFVLWPQKHLSTNINWNSLTRTDEKNPPLVLTLKTCLRDVVDLHCNSVPAQTERRLESRLPHTKPWPSLSYQGTLFLHDVCLNFISNLYFHDSKASRKLTWDWRDVSADLWTREQWKVTFATEFVIW